MDLLMAPSAGDQRLAVTCCPPLDPERFFFLSRSVEICEAPDVVDLAGAFHRPAPLTNLGEEALHHFAAPAVDVFGAVKDTRVVVPRQGDATAHRHQRLFARASGLLDHQGRQEMAAVLDQLLHATPDRADLRLLLVGQCAEPGGVPHAIHSPQAVGMHCQPIVLDQAPVFCLILLDDAKVVIDKSFRPVHGLVLPHVRSALCHDDVLGDLQTNGGSVANFGV
jgi:hypothetical protein